MKSKRKKSTGLLTDAQDYLDPLCAQAQGFASNQEHQANSHNFNNFSSLIVS